MNKEVRVLPQLQYKIVQVILAHGGPMTTSELERSIVEALSMEGSIEAMRAQLRRMALAGVLESTSIDYNDGERDRKQNAYVVTKHGRILFVATQHFYAPATG